MGGGGFYTICVHGRLKLDDSLETVLHAVIYLANYPKIANI